MAALAEGRVSPVAALTFALALAVAGLGLLLAFTNPLAAWLTLEQTRSATVSKSFAMAWRSL